MGETTKIAWCDHTFNPVRGCQKVSEGCKFCYAEASSKRNPAVFGKWGSDGTRVVAAESQWRQPLKWDRDAQAAGVRRRVFCASLADVFEDRPEWVAPRVRLFHLIHETPHLDWLLLTKRPENWSRLCGDGAVRSWAENTPPNVWMGTSVENQAAADERIPLLLKIPAKVRFLSVEPLLDSVDLTRLWLPDKSGWWNALDGRLTAKAKTDAGQEFWCETVGRLRPPVDWVIIGGESGPHARRCYDEWVHPLVEQCRNAGTAVFVKQMGSVWAQRHNAWRCSPLLQASMPAADTKGGNPEAWPESLRVREFPRHG